MKNLVSDPLKIVFTKKTKEEKKIHNLIKECHKLINVPSIPPQKIIDTFSYNFKKLNSAITNYQGRFSNYFNSEVKMIKQEEKWAFGYGLNDPSF